MADERDEIRARIDLVELVGQRVSLKRTGKTFKGLCPFHDDRNPSFTVDPTTGRYRCWSCGEAGDAFTWLMKTQGMTFVEALRELAQRTGITLRQTGETTDRSVRDAYRAQMNDALTFFREQLARNESARAYCNRRGLSAEVLERWEIGYAPDVGDALASQLKRKGHSLSDGKLLFLVDQDGSGGYFDKFRGRLMFPIRDERGELVAFGGRLLGDGHPKYINSSDTPLYRKSKVLYGAQFAKEHWGKERRAILVEGYLDVIACHEGGVPQAVASLGTALSEDQAKYLGRMVRAVVILYDSDGAGVKAAARASEILNVEGMAVRVASLPEKEDPDSILRKAGRSELVRVIETAQDPLTFQLVAMEGALGLTSENFWSQAVAKIASFSGQPKLYNDAILALAAKFPGFPDPVAAARELRKLIDRHVGGASQSLESPEGSILRSREGFLDLKLLAEERAVFSAFLEPQYRRFAWMVITKMSHLFVSVLATELVGSVQNAFAMGPPDGEPMVWLHRLDNEEHERVLSDLAMKSLGAPMSETFIADAVKRLQTEAQKRHLALLKRGDTTQEQRLEILKRLREINVDTKAVAKKVDDDPFA